MIIPTIAKLFFVLFLYGNLNNRIRIQDIHVYPTKLEGVKLKWALNGKLIDIVATQINLIPKFWINNLPKSIQPIKPRLKLMSVAVDQESTILIPVNLKNEYKIPCTRKVSDKPSVLSKG